MIAGQKTNKQTNKQKKDNNNNNNKPIFSLLDERRIKLMSKPYKETFFSLFFFYLIKF